MKKSKKIGSDQLDKKIIAEAFDVFILLKRKQLTKRFQERDKYCED